MAGNFLGGNFLAGNFLSHVVIFGNFMAGNFLGGNLLGGYRLKTLVRAVYMQVKRPFGVCKNGALCKIKLIQILVLID